MKTKLSKLLFTALALTVSVVSFSQNTTPKDSTEVKKDSVLPLKYKFNNLKQGGLYLNNPTEKVVSFDKSINKFVIVEKIGDYYVGTPIFMTPKEYNAYRLNNDVKSYFKEKNDARNSKKKGSDEARKNLLPKYYVNSKFFESVFGGSEVEVIPSGQINIKLGGLYQNTENPAISVQNQKSFTFDFDQQISSSLQAKVGKRLQVTANYDTQSTFDFQNVIKLEYSPTEDDILQKLDAGNVNLPIKNSLINGAQALFGVRADFQFGKTTIRTAYSQQNSQSKTVVAEGGAVIEPFELQATDYDNDRHFFLSQYFRESYKGALKNYPLVSSPVNITRIEVWVTNRSQSIDDYRSVIAFADMGESVADNMVSGPEGYVAVNPNPTRVNSAGDIRALPYNEVNAIGDFLTEDSGIRDIATLNGVIPVNMVEGTDYSYLQNARKLQANEFTLHPQLGYISLNRRLNDGEVLAVAYEYTVVGASNNEAVFKVGEFSNDGIIAPANIAVKLLRSEILTTVRDVDGNSEPFPTWRLMMKNVYALGAYPLNQEGFRFELLYRDDQLGVLLNTLQGANINNDNDSGQDPTLINIFNVDQLDQSQFRKSGGDGYFDYVEGVTVNSNKGLIFFPSPEPFGEDLEETLEDVFEGQGSVDIENYIFKDLYLTTKLQAKNEYQNKDKYFLKGYFKSDASRGISLGAFNVPRGSVRVTAGGRTLVEGVDYVVDYQLGRVQILDPSLEASGVPINASLENNTFFNQQRKTFLGVDVEHKISENFMLGASFLNVTERPITPKVNYGAEPIDNIMFGFNADFSTEMPLFTKLANKLPFVDTDAPSNLSIRADMAYLVPGSPSGIDVDGTATAYVDDFEGSQVPISLNAPQQWFLASTPISDPKFNGDLLGDPSYNNKRAKLAWYNVDQLFYGSGGNRPDNIDDFELSRDEVRRISYTELFPFNNLDITQLNLVRTLDLAYYPNERGPYNFMTDQNNTDGVFDNPEDNWGGIMRALTTNNFEQANVEYIQFWLLDPYENYSITEAEGKPANIDHTSQANQGKLYINLGNISEDILRDKQKQYENGLNTNENPSPEIETIWGKVPRNPSIVYAFSSDDSERTQQDVGLDGLSDEIEKTVFPRGAIISQDDPAADNFQFFRSDELDAIDASILTRYKNYNGTEGNSPTINQSTESYPTSSTTYPDTEDINRDQTMNSVSAYYEYEVSLKSGDFDEGSNYIVDTKSEQVTLANGETRAANWYQFRIPVRTGFTEAFGGITDFNSIRFMRMYLSGFRMPVVLRMAELELVRGDWRRYTKVPQTDPTQVPVDDVDIPFEDINNFEVGVVSIEQNEDSYQLPPGIQREQLQGTNRIQQQNEQSVTVKVTDLEAKGTRAIYKNISIDLRRYKELRMFLHAERQTGTSNEDLVAVIRLGTDLSDNFYQIEKPLQLSPTSSTEATDVWPTANNLNVPLEELANLKLRRETIQPDNVNVIYSEDLVDDNMVIGVKGNPSLARVRTVMLGIKNKSDVEKTGEIWFNELRAVGFDNKGGWAGVFSADANFADVADVSLAGNISTVGFGSVEQRVQERSIEDHKQYNVSTNVQLGKMMPKKWNMQVPMSYSYGEEFIDPKYDQQYQDITVKKAKESGSERAKKNAENSQDYTRRKSISFINVKKNRNPESKKTPKFYDVENVSASYAFNEEFHRDYSIEKYINQNLMAGLSYNFNFKPFSIEPFKKSEKLKGKYWRLIKDINFNPVPNVLSLNSKVNRNYTSQQYRNLVEGFSAQPELKQRRFLFDWDYTIGFDLTKSLQLNFNAANNYIYDGFGSDEELGIYDKFFNVGRANNYHQKLNATYKLPIDKIPFLGFISSDYAYTADFDWQAASQSTVNETDPDTGLIEEIKITDKVGNMIQNANTHNLNANIDFNKLYKSIRLENLFVKGRKKPTKKGKTTTPTPRRQVSRPVKLKKNAPFSQKLLKGVYDVLTSVKKAQISYSQNNGTLMEGYKPSVGFLGRNNYNGSLAPNLGFVFGSQTDILYQAIDNNWVVARDSARAEAYYNKNYSKTTADKLDYTISVKPIKSLTIDLRGNRIKTSNISQQLDVLGDYDDSSGDYNNRKLNTSIKPFETGNYSISHFMLGTTFENADALYQKFLNYRNAISRRLSVQNGLPNTSEAGYQLNGQQAMLPAFLAAYSGYNPNKTSTGVFRNVPLPNWTLRYNGFMKKKWFKKKFSAFTISHAYKSSYTIANFTNNLQYDYGVTNSSGNYQPELLISQATLIDEFSPLIKVDMKMRNAFSFRGEIKTDRSLTLNLNNNTLTDINGTEYVVGLGYKISDVKFVTRITGKKETLKGDINLRADISLRDNLTLIRSVDEENNQITGGETLFGLKFIADYNLSKSLTASFYYNHNTYQYAISTNFPRQSINAGLNIVYNLGN